MDKTGQGYEYEVVEVCEKSGRPVRVYAPKAWGHKVAPRPYYTSCTCARHKGLRRG